jgi:putative intracellular protease/amidase/DNA-binding ferritin-like protein
MRILIVLTSHDQLGNTGKKTGFWLEEFAAPYYVLKDAGATITLASPKGGQPPLDPKSDLPENQTESTKRFRKDTAAQAQLADTQKLADVSANDFDAVFYPGGHGPMWDMPDNAISIALIEAFVKADKPVAAVCHASAALVNVRGQDGEYLVKGKRVTGFTNAEETAVGLTAVVPFLLEDRLKERGGLYGKTANWAPYVQVDGKLVTGQNPAASGPAAEALLKLLAKRDSEKSSELVQRRKAPLITPTDLGAAASKDIAGAMNAILADVFALYLKTKNFHWHMSGPHFRDYHELLDEHADQLYSMTDPVAERIRKVGGTTLRSIGHIGRLQRIQDNDADFVEPLDMLAELRDDNLTLAARLRAVHEVCDEHRDIATASLIENWIDETEKRSWFLFETSRRGLSNGQ